MLGCHGSRPAGGLPEIQWRTEGAAAWVYRDDLTVENWPRGSSDAWAVQTTLVEGYESREQAMLHARAEAILRIAQSIEGLIRHRMDMAVGDGTIDGRTDGVLRETLSVERIRQGMNSLELEYAYGLDSRGRWAYALRVGVPLDKFRQYLLGQMAAVLEQRRVDKLVTDVMARFEALRLAP